MDLDELAASNVDSRCPNATTLNLDAGACSCLILAAHCRRLEAAVASEVARSELHAGLLFYGQADLQFTITRSCSRSRASGTTPCWFSLTKAGQSSGLDCPASSAMPFLPEGFPTRSDRNSGKGALW